MGVMMCFSRTIFMLRFGIFIVLLMLFGWLYAFFFLLPLLAAFGPLGNVGELPWNWRKAAAVTTSKAKAGNTTL